MSDQSLRPHLRGHVRRNFAIPTPYAGMCEEISPRPHIRGHGEIGRRARFRILYREMCRFKSCCPYQKRAPTREPFSGTDEQSVPAPPFAVSRQSREMRSKAEGVSARKGNRAEMSFCLIPNCGGRVCRVQVLLPVPKRGGGACLPLFWYGRTVRACTSLCGFAASPRNADGVSKKRE